MRILSIGLVRAIDDSCNNALFDRHNEVRTSCCLITTSVARRKPEVQAFRAWVRQMAANERRDLASSQ